MYWVNVCRNKTRRDRIPLSEQTMGPKGLHKVAGAVRIAGSDVLIRYQGRLAASTPKKRRVIRSCPNLFQKVLANTKTAPGPEKSSDQSCGNGTRGG